MNLEEYKEWLKQNANLEEANAYEVAKEIIEYHSNFWERGRDLRVELFPRKVIVHEGDRLEFDLVMVFEWVTDTFGYKRTYTRTVGVEFKETDVKKVLHQAIRRRDFVDYMYIATRNVVLDHIDHILMAEFGIGWVVWDEDFAKMIIPSHYKYPVHSIKEIINYLAEKAVEDKLEKKLKELKLVDFFQLG